MARKINRRVGQCLRAVKFAEGGLNMDNQLLEKRKKNFDEEMLKLRIKELEDKVRSLEIGFKEIMKILKNK